MNATSWRPGFHLSPAVGWANDPNGLCQFNGRYHVFFQHTADWPQSTLKDWQHYSSADLLHWEDHGVALAPSMHEDSCGAYSGCAWVERGGAPDGGDLMRVYYTGNVTDHEAGDCIHVGREANQIMVTSTDGVSFGEKDVQLTNADYPATCTQHVRDPKVWKQDGRLYMLLGARTQKDVGQVLVMASDDGRSWRLHHQIDSVHPFGFMWECPNVAQVDGHDFLAVCPQGLPSEAERWQNLWQAGYFPLDDSLLTTTEVDEHTFVEWDHGFDFYAPQIFVDDTGRTLLVGWMGVFQEDQTAVPDGLPWCHCLTVPRELTLGEDGLLRQTPARELEQLRHDEAPLTPGTDVLLPDLEADIALTNIAEGDVTLTLNDALRLTVAGGYLKVRFLDDAAGAGRSSRIVPLDGGKLDDLRVLVDGSTVEVYANGGATVFSTRWFPHGEKGLRVRASFAGATARAWQMYAPLHETYEPWDSPAPIRACA